MDEIESELLLSATELLAPLRQGVGLVPAAAERLKQSLRVAASEWSNSTTITKSAANLFVDLASGIYACSYAYGGEKADQVRPSQMKWAT